MQYAILVEQTISCTKENFENFVIRDEMKIPERKEQII